MLVSWSHHFLPSSLMSRPKRIKSKNPTAVPNWKYSANTFEFPMAFPPASQPWRAAGYQSPPLCAGSAWQRMSISGEIKFFSDIDLNAMSTLLLLAMNETIFCDKKLLEVLKDILWACHVLLRVQCLGSKCKNRVGQSRWLPIPVPLWGGSRIPSRAAGKPHGEISAEMQHLFALPVSQPEGSAVGSCCTTKFSQIREDADCYSGHQREGGLCGNCFRTQE